MKRIIAKRQDRFLFKRRLISVAVMSAVSGHLNANPTGPQVVNGQASVTTQGSVLTVTNTPNAIVNWQSFSIGGNETTRFVQQSAASAVLNRVVGVDPSVILGTLQSNGKVLLINTNGIMFGQGARVDVAGLVASTLNLNDQDFLAGRLNFQSSPLGSGSVVNRGTIATPEGGSVFLVGSAVENSGIIHAPGGEVILAAGQSVRLGSTGAPNVLVEVEAPANRAVNLGEIAVGAGKAGIYGGFVEQKGIVSANTATVNAAGKIVFKATRDATLAAGSSTTAGGAQGGTVAVESGGTTRVDGVVSATGASGKGGTIHLLGKQVGVAGGAAVDASGAAGGGTILVGGDYKGGNLDVVNARATFVGADTRLRADATSKGDGGRIIVWSGEVTRAYGNISARGGPLGGDGGFVETSSHSFLSVLNAPDIAAPLGRGGTWLLDPYNLTVIAGASGAGSLDGPPPNFNAGADNSTVSNAAIQNVLNAGGDVVLDTRGTGGGTQAGDITVDAPIAMTGSAPATMQFLAANNIYLTGNAHVSSSAGVLHVVLNSDVDANGTGAVILNGASIVTNGGDLTIGGGTNPLTGYAVSSGANGDGVLLIDSTLITGAGAISIRGRTNAASGAFGDGVNLQGNSLIQTTSGDVTIRGEASARAGDVNFAAGVRLLGAQTISSQTGTVRLEGVAAGTPGAAATTTTQGVVLQNDTLVQVTGPGRIEFHGDGGTTSASTAGVMLLDNARVLADAGGTIVMTGTPGAPAPGGAVQNGVTLGGPGVIVRAGGAGGSITLTGLPANGTVVENANGVVLQAGSLVEATGTATITISGTGSDTSIATGWAGTTGLLMFDAAQIRSAGGAISITGHAGLTTQTAAGAEGISIFGAGTAITTLDGTIQITGTGGGTPAAPTAQSAYGVWLAQGARVEATGLGSVTIKGTGGFAAGIAQADGTAPTSTSGIHIASGGAVVTVSGLIEMEGNAGNTAKLADGSWGVSLFGESGDAAPNTGIFSTSGDIIVTGIGPGTVVQRSGSNAGGVFMFQRASIQTGAAGNITITGNAGTGSGGYLQGVSLWGGFAPADGNHPTVRAQDGTIAITAVGGSTDSKDTPWPGQVNSTNDGIELAAGGQVVVTGATGHIELTGTGGNAAQGFNNGITIFTADSADPVTGVFATGGGTISMTGNANGPSNYTNGSHGISLSGVQSQVRSAGHTTLAGYGISDGTGSQNSDGVALLSGASIVTTANGSIEITGIGGGTLANPLDQNGRGVTLGSGAIVQATSTGSISINGTGGVSGSADMWAGNSGVAVNGGSQVSTAAGNIIISGQGGQTEATSSGSRGVELSDLGSLISSIDGSIQITGTGGGTLARPSGQSADGVVVQNGAAVQASGTGSIHIVGVSGVTQGIFDPNNRHFFTAGAISSYTQGVLVQGTGKVATNSGSITIAGTGAAVFSDSVGAHGVLVSNAGTAVTSTSGNIAITGVAGGTSDGRSGGDSLGVLVFDHGSVSTGGGGGIQLTGTGGATNGGIGIGVSIYQGAEVIAHDGNITLRGTGSTSTNTFTLQGDFANGGVEVGGASTVQTKGAGSILLDGIAGNAAGGGNRGVAVFEGSLVEAQGIGSVTLHGVLTSAQLNAVASTVVGDANNGGVWIASSGIVRTGTSLVAGGAINITGLGPVDGTGASTPQLFGVRIEGGSKIDSAAGGAISIFGDLRDARAAGLQGVDITNLSQVLGNAGNVSITGIGGGANRSDADGVVISNGALVETSFGNITLTGSLIDFANLDGRYLQGVTVVGATVRTTATGSITLDGTGPGTLANRVKGKNSGIAIVNGANVVTEGGGDITLVGSGGFATDGFISGVYISSDFVFVDNEPDGPGAPVTVTAAGTGKVTITGFLGSPGSQNGINSAGVSIQGFTPVPGSGAGRPIGASVTTEDGALTITGYGSGFVRSATPSIDETLAGAGSLQGVYLANDAHIGSKGSGAVRIEGNAGVVRGYLKDSFANPGTPVLGVDASGVTIEKSATVFSTSAALNILATGGYSNNANAQVFGFPAGTVAEESVGGLIAGGNAEFPTVISSVAGDIRIRVTAPGTPAQPIGSEAGAAFGFGNISVSTSAAHTIEVFGDFGATTNGHSSAVWFRDAIVNFDAGAVNLLGNTGSVSVSTNTGSNPVRAAGVEIHNSTLTTSGVLNITGVGGGAANGQNYGVWIHDGSHISSANPAAAIAIVGTGGGSGSANSGSDGVNISIGSVLSMAGDISIHGSVQTAPGTNHSTGVSIQNASIVETNGGSITIEGTGPGTSAIPALDHNRGVWIGDASRVEVSNAGSLSIVGNAGVGTGGFLEGVTISPAATAAVTTVISDLGDLSIVGSVGSAAAGTDNIGVVITGGVTNSVHVGSMDGNVHIQGAVPVVSSDSYGVYIEAGASVQTVGLGSISISGSIGALGNPDGVGIFFGGSGGPGGIVSTAGRPDGSALTVGFISVQASSGGIEGAPVISATGCGCSLTHGGDITISAAGSILLDGTIVSDTVDAGVPGTIRLQAGGEVFHTGLISASATGLSNGAAGGIGGTIVITATGKVDVLGMHADGGDSSHAFSVSYPGGRGGSITVTGSGSIILRDVSARGGAGGAGDGDTFPASAGGDGGVVQITANPDGQGHAVVDVTAELRGGTGGGRGGPGGAGRGMAITSSASNLAVSAVIDASGGDGGEGGGQPAANGGPGGRVTIEAPAAALQVGGSFVLKGGDAGVDSGPMRGGDGGSLVLSTLPIPGNRNDIVSIPSGTPGSLTLGSLTIDTAGGLNNIGASGEPLAGPVDLVAGDGGIAQTGALTVNTPDLRVLTSGNAILNRQDNGIQGVWGDVRGDLWVTSNGLLRLGYPNAIGFGLGPLHVGGNLRAESAAGSGVFGTCVADSCVWFTDGVTAGGNIELYADDIDDEGPIVTGSLDANFFRWAPWTAGLNLTIDDFESDDVVAPHIQLGNPAGPTFGTVTLIPVVGVEPATFNPLTRSLEVYAAQVDIDGQYGGTTPLPLSFVAHALGDVNVGTHSGTSIHLGDGHTLSLVADTDLDGAGDLTVGGTQSGSIDIRVGTPASAISSGMELRAANVRFQGRQVVWLFGPGSQAVAAQQDIRLSISSPDNDFLSVGSEGSTDVTAGGSLFIESLGNSSAQFAGDFNSPVGIGKVNITVAGDVRMTNGSSPNSGAFIMAGKGMTIDANSLQLIGAAGGGSVGIQNQQGAQTITTHGAGPNGWGIELTNYGSKSSLGSGVDINASGSQQVTVNNSSGILLNALGHRTTIGGGSQVISTTGDIVLLGGVAGQQVWSDLASQNGQTITARSISITDGGGPASTGIFAQGGTQRVATTGSAANGYGLTIRNLGATGTDQNGASASAYIYDRTGAQIIDVADSDGILMEGLGGEAFLGTDGPSQTITLHGTGANRLDLTAALGGATVYFGDGIEQNISAGAITMNGGTADSAAATLSAQGGTQTVTVVGDLLMQGGTHFGSHAHLLAFGDQTVSARSIRMTSNAGGGTAALYTEGANQHITTSGSGATGWGIELVNLGPADGQDVYIQSAGNQQIQALNGGGILLNAAGGGATIRGGVIYDTNGPQATGTQTVQIDGAGANRLELRGGTGAAFIDGANQSVTAGSTAPGSILLEGSAFNYGAARIMSELGTQVVATTGQLELRAGSAPDAGQAMYHCEFGGGCALILAQQQGGDPSVVQQRITASGIVLHGGTGGAYNEAMVFSHGTQEVTVTGAGGILIQGGAGTGNQASIGSGGGAGYSQTITFGAGDLQVLGGTSGGHSSGELVSQGSQTISGTGSITVKGGVLPDNGTPAKFYDPTNPAADANGFVHDAVVFSYAIVAGNMSGDPLGSQTITAKSIDIEALEGRSSTGIFALDGVQTISTTGASASGFGLTVRNSGARGGPEQGGFDEATAYIAIRFGKQVIDVANSNGIRLLGDAGWAGIFNGDIVQGFIDAPGVGQTITVHGAGINTILLDAGTGQVSIFGYFKPGPDASQTIVAGRPGEAGSISLQGGTADVSGAWITAETGTQRITTTGSLTLTGGATPSATGVVDFGELDCAHACASVLAKTAQQTIDVGAIALEGGASGNENFASIRANAGQDITVRGAGGLRITGGGAADNTEAFSDFAMIENHSGSQTVRFLTAGAPLTIDAGDKGERHFAGLYNASLGGGGQQILGDPTITVTAGTGGSGTSDPDRRRFTSNYAFIGSESGPQVVNATSIALLGGGADSNIADLVNWGGSPFGGLLGSQTITTVGALTLQGGAGANANARLYSHSGNQTVSVGGALTMARPAGGGDVFLGNVYDPSVLNIDINLLEISVAGGLQLQGGHIWGDDGITLHLPSGGSATAGTIHAGRASAPTNGGDIVVDAGRYVTIDGSLTLAGKVDIGTGVALLELVGGTLTVGDTISNNGILQLRTSAANLPAALVASGPLNNAPGAIVQSITAGGTSANTISAAEVVNQGTFEIDHTLTVSNTSRTFDTIAGTLEIGAGEALQIANGTMRIGSGTGHGARTGKLNLQGSVTLLLDDDVTLSSTGFQLGLGGGTVTIDGSEALTLTNLGDLMLASTTLTRVVKLDNQGTLTVQAGRAAALDGGLVQSGTVNLVGGTVSETTLSVAGGLLNNGVVTLGTSVDNLPSRLVVSGGALVNAGTIQSFSQGGAAANTIDANVHNQSLLDVRHSLSLLGTQTAGNDGIVSISSGAVLSLVSDYTNNPAGTIEGSGTLALPGFTLTNAGTLKPGGVSVGTLSIQGNMVADSGSVLEVQITGVAAGQYDVIDVSGTATLDGTLKVLFPGTYQGARDDSFQILTAAAVGGVFDTITVPGAIGATPVYRATDVSLTLGLLNQWIGTSGLWTVDSNWSLGVPAATHDVEIDVTGQQTITIPLGSILTVHDLLLSEDLLLDTSALTVSGLLSMNPSATITLQGTGTGGAFLNVANGFVNTGTIVLNTASTGVQPRLTVANGTLTNNGAIISQGVPGAGAAEINAEVVNASTIVVNHSLALIDNVGRVFDSSGGTLAISSGNELSVNGGRTRIGTNSLGASAGTLRLQGTSHVLELTGNLTLPARALPDTESQLDLTNGLVTIDSNVAGGVTLTNLGTLDLGGDVITANVAVDNQGTLRVPGGSGGTIQGVLMQAGTIQVQASAAGNAFFTASNGFANTGTIQLQAGPGSSVSRFSVTTGALTNTGEGAVRSLTAGGTGANQLNAQVIAGDLGVIDVAHDLTITGEVTIASSAAGAVVTGVGTLAINGSFTVNATDFDNVPRLDGGGVLRTNGTSAVSGGQLHSARRWENLGAMTINGRLTLEDGAQLTNAAGATLTLAGTNAAPIALGGTAATVINAGTLTKTSTAEQTIQTAFNNSGTVNVNADVLNLAGNAIQTHTGTFNVNGAGSELAFLAGAHELTNVTFGGAGRVRVNGASVDFATQTQAANPFTLQGGTVTGAGDLTLSGPFTLSGGRLTGTGLFTTTGTTTENNGLAILDGRTWNNSGSMTINGLLHLDNSATLVNQAGGSIEISSINTNPTPLVWDGAGTRPTLVNRGTVTKNSTVDVQLDLGLDNAGVLNVNNTSLAVSQLIAGTNAGTINVAGGATLSSTGLPLTNVGAINLASGARWASTGQVVTNTGAINIAGGATFSTNGSPLNNESGATIDLAGTLDLGAADLRNSGRMSIADSPGVLRAGSLGNIGTLALAFATVDVPVVNQGVIQVGPGSDSTINGLLTQRGTISLQADATGGGTLRLGQALANEGQIELQAGGGFTSLLYVAGSLTNTGSLQSVGSGTAYNYVDASGGVVHQGQVVVDHDLFFENSLRTFDASSNGRFDVAAGQTLTVNSGTVRLGNTTSFADRSGTLSFQNAAVDLAGDVTIVASGPRVILTGSSSLTAAQPVTLTVGSTLDLANDTVAANVTLLNAGTLILASTPVSGALINLGSVQVAEVSTVQTLTQQGGSISVDAGKVLQVLGDLDWWSGDIAGTVSSANLSLTTAGTRVLTGSLSSGTVTLTGGRLDVRDGAALFSAGDTDIGQAAQLTLSGGVLNSVDALTNAGRVMARGGSLTAASTSNAASGTFTVNGATVTAGPLTNDGTVTLQSGALTVGTVTNTGTVNLNGGVFGHTGTFGNSGMVHVNVGTLTLDAGDGALGGGSYDVASGATLQFTGGIYGVGALTNAGAVIASGGSLTAASTGNAASGVFTVNGATVAAGPLTNDGTTTLQSGTLNVGTVTNTGTLNLNGGVFGHAGTFGNSGTVHVNAGTLTLDAGDGALGGGSYAVGTGGTLEFTGGNYTVGAVSNAGTVRATGGVLNTTSIDNASGAFTVDGAAVAAGPFASGGTTTLSSGSLSVGVVANRGTLNLNGGTFNRAANAAFGNSGAVHLNVGTLSLAGGDASVRDGSYDVASGATLRFAGGDYRVGALTNAGIVMASGGSLTAASTGNAATGIFTVNGATVVAGPLTNDGTTTLQSGSLSVGAVTNTGTLNLNGGTFTRAANAAFGNSGAVHLNVGTLSLAGGDASVRDGSYDVASGATLRFAGGDYQVGALTNAGTVMASGGSLTAASTGNAPGGIFTVNGATVAIGPLTNDGTTTLQSGSLSVGTVTNRGTLNLDGGTFTRAANTTFGNSGAVHLNVGALVLDAGDGGLGGGSYDVGSGATLRYAGGDYRLGALTNAGTTTQQSGSLTVGTVINRGTLNLDGGTFTRPANAAFGNSGTVHLNVGTLSLAGGEAGVSGGSYVVGTAGALQFAGGNYEVGALTNAGTTTLQAGTLSVAELSNSGTLSLDGGTFTYGAGKALKNSGLVRVNTGTLSLDGGDGGVKGGRYEVGSAAMLRLTAGSYNLGSVRGEGNSEIDGARVTATDVSVASGRQLLLTSGSLNAGTLNNSGQLTVKGAAVQTDALTNSGTATLQSGSLEVGAVTNTSTGVLNLKGEMLTRQSGQAFGNAGTVNLTSGNLSLDGGDGGTGGGTYNLAAGTRLSFANGDYGIGVVAGAGAVEVKGATQPVKLYAGNSMKISAQTLSVIAGAHSATIDPPDLVLNVPGGVTLTGGSTSGAHALIQGGSVSLSTSAISMTGGAGVGSYAGIQAMSGPATITVDTKIDMTPGAGQSAGAWMTATGPLKVTAVSCKGCAVLSDDPLTSGQAGLYGFPVSLTLLGGVIQVPSSVIVGVQTAQGGGEGDAILSTEEEGEKDAENNEQSAEQGGAREEHTRERPRQICM